MWVKTVTTGQGEAKRNETDAVYCLSLRRFDEILEVPKNLGIPSDEMPNDNTNHVDKEYKDPRSWSTMSDANRFSVESKLVPVDKIDECVLAADKQRTVVSKSKVSLLLNKF